MENKTKNIYEKLFDAKKEIGKLTKDSKNPFFKSSYLSLNGLLEAVEDVLQKHNLLLMQPIEEGKVCTYIIDIDEIKDKFVCSAIELPNNTDPQKLGSAITYYRRYTLQSLLGLQAEDDDANSVSNATKTVNHSKTESPWLNIGDVNWNKGLKQGASLITMQKHFRINEANQKEYVKSLNSLKQ